MHVLLSCISVDVRVHRLPESGVASEHDDSGDTERQHEKQDGVLENGLHGHTGIVEVFWVLLIHSRVAVRVQSAVTIALHLVHLGTKGQVRQ